MGCMFVVTFLHMIGTGGVECLGHTTNQIPDGNPCQGPRSCENQPTSNHDQGDGHEGGLTAA